MIGSHSHDSVAAGGRVCDTGHMSRSLTPVNRVGVDERAAALGRRSIKTTAKREGIRIATSMIDLTTLEGSDTPGKVRHLCAKAVCPDPSRPEIPSVAAVCVYPALVGVAAEALRGSGVAGRLRRHRLPGRADLAGREGPETREAVAAGATEIDMVISREAYLAGDDARVAREIAAVKEACGDAHLKVILETAELPTYAHVRHASELAITAGADVIKTSTGKVDLGRDAGRRAGDARGRARAPVADRVASSASRPRAASRTPRRRCTCSCSSRRRSATTG